MRASSAFMFKACDVLTRLERSFRPRNASLAVTAVAQLQRRCSGQIQAGRCVLACRKAMHATHPLFDQFSIKCVEGCVAELAKIHANLPSARQRPDATRQEFHRLP